MKFSLREKTVLEGVAKSALTNNRVLGFISAELVTTVMGGKALGGGNKPVQWVSPEGVVHAMGTGSLSSAFIASSNKGTGRTGKQLKEGSKFCHLSVDLKTHTMEIRIFTRKEVEAFS